MQLNRSSNLDLVCHTTGENVVSLLRADLYRLSEEKKLNEASRCEKLRQLRFSDLASQYHGQEDELNLMRAICTRIESEMGKILLVCPQVRTYALALGAIRNFL